jgi:hypothetical protein
MPLYTVIRPFPGATKTELDAASFRSLTCLRYHDGLAWIRSFWNPATEILTCIYEAQDPEQIRFHAQRADIPCDEIVEVQEVLPTDYMREPEPVPAGVNGNAVTDGD